MKDLHVTKKPKLLIVEDNYELLNHLADFMADFYDIHCAANGKEAISLVSRIYPDVIVSDVMMPEMDGWQLCHEIKQNPETSHIPVILLTALTSNQHKKEGFKTGADSYLEKPFDIELLQIQVDSLLKNRQRLIEKFSHNPIQNLDDSIAATDREFIGNVVNIIERNLSNYEFSVEQLGKTLGLSHAALYRKFSVIIGKSPNEFINQYRLKKSMELLVNGKYNINEIAYMVGFSDPKYFSTVFKKYYGKNASVFLPKTGTRDIPRQD